MKKVKIDFGIWLKACEKRIVIFVKVITNHRNWMII